MFRHNDSHREQKLFHLAPVPSERITRLANHWSTKFYSDIFCKIKEDDFSELYCNDNGRPNTPVNVLVGFEILKAMFQISDMQTYERFLYDSVFHNALGIENPDTECFAIRTLYNFRFSVADHEQQTGINLIDQVFAEGRDRIIKELGLKTGLQRIDSVQIGANIKRMNRLTLFHKVLSNLVRLIKKLDLSVSEEIEKLIKDDEDAFAYRLPSDEVTTATKKIACKIFELLELYKNDSLVGVSQEYALARRLIGEQCHVNRHQHSADLQLKDAKEIASGSLQNPGDPDATYRRKKNEDYRGYAAHVAETCDPENKIQVITHVELRPNNIDDTQILMEGMATMKSATNLECMISDGGFITQKTHNQAAQNNINLIATGIRGRKPENKTLTTKDFTYREDGLVARCPAGESPIKQIQKPGVSVKASFDKRKCSICELRKTCMAFFSESSCQLLVTPGRLKLDTFGIKDEEEFKLRNLRPPVEGLMSDMKPRYLRGRTLFRGRIRVGNRMYFRAISINFKRTMGKKGLFGSFTLFFVRFLQKFQIFAHRLEFCPG